MQARFADRAAAGRALAEAVRPLVQPPAPQPVVVLGVMRGGVAVAYEVARALAVPLDAIAVAKVGVPGQPELAMGAVGEDGVAVVEPEVVTRGGIDVVAWRDVAQRARATVARLVALRAGQPPADLTGATAVLVDDGLATGATARAAVAVLRGRGAARVIAAVPVAAPGPLARLRRDVDEVLALVAPRRFTAVGNWYEDFAAVLDDQVLDLLRRSREPSA